MAIGSLDSRTDADPARAGIETEMTEAIEIAANVVSVASAIDAAPRRSCDRELRRPGRAAGRWGRSGDVMLEAYEGSLSVSPRIARLEERTRRRNREPFADSPRTPSSRGQTSRQTSLVPRHLRPSTPLAAACSILLAGGGVAFTAHGQIAFDPPQTIPLPEDHLPTAVLPVDLDGDGILDLVVPGRGLEGRVERFRGLEDGTFAALPALELGAPTDEVAAGDLDGDGDLDLVFAVRSARGRLAVLANLGDHEFASAVEVPLEREPRGVFLADLDGNGTLDAVAVNYGSNSISTLAGDGGGGFAPADVRTIGRENVAICYPQEAEAADLDLDGTAEAVIPAIGNGRVRVAKFSGSDLAIPPTTGTISPWIVNQQSAITTLATGDLDGDGDLDVVTPVILLGLPQAVVVYANDGSGGLEDRSHFQTTLSGFAWCAAVADFTGDGLPEIAAGMAIPGAIVVLENQTPAEGGAAFAPAAQIHEGSFIRSLATGDVDRDGWTDLVAVDIASDLLLVFRNRAGDGGLAGVSHGVKDDAVREPSIGRAFIGNASEADAPRPRPRADLNRDGRLDARDLAIELADFGLRDRVRRPADVSAGERSEDR